jgi:hypothetical protein
VQYVLAVTFFRAVPADIDKIYHHDDFTMDSPPLAVHSAFVFGFRSIYGF